MNGLFAEFRRLYFLPEQVLRVPDAGNSTVATRLVAKDGVTRTMVLSFERSTDWEYVAKLYQAVHEDLALPVPAVSAAGGQGYQLWFSLADQVSIEQASHFLHLLQRVFLREIKTENLTLWPDVGALAGEICLPPECHELTGKWSAFIDPGMGSMFVEEPGLGMAPMMDRQADLLADLECIKADAFARALDLLQAASSPPEPAAPRLEEGSLQSECTAVMLGSGPNSSNAYSDPKSFLLAVMNDSSVSVADRIEAAKALLPYFEKTPGLKVPSGN